MKTVWISFLPTGFLEEIEPIIFLHKHLELDKWLYSECDLQWPALDPLCMYVQMYACIHGLSRCKLFNSNNENLVKKQNVGICLLFL